MFLGSASIDLLPKARGPNSIFPWNQPIAFPPAIYFEAELYNSSSDF